VIGAMGDCRVDPKFVRKDGAPARPFRKLAATADDFCRAEDRRPQPRELIVNKVSARQTRNTRSVVLAASLLGAYVALACGAAAAADVPHFARSSAMPLGPSAGPRGGACGSITITQSSTQTITAANSVSCNAGGLHADNSYFRAFDLASLGAPNGLDVCEVQVGVEQATSTGAAGQPVTVNLYTTSSAFPTGYPGSLTQIGTASITLPDSATNSVYSIPVTGSAPAGSELVVELFTPDGQTAGNSFFIGSNTDPQSGPSYILAGDCGITAPTDTATIGFPNMHIVMNAIGNPAGPSDVIFADGFDNGVVIVAPTLTKGFVPASVVANANSTLTLTLDNTGNANPATLTADLVDTFPAGLVVATPSDAATTCASGTATATAGGSSLTLGTGAQIPASGTCTVTVSVTSATAGTYTNTVAAGGLQTDLGNSAADATADLTVTSGGGGCTTAQLLADTSFEASLAGGPWASTSTNFGTAMCDNASCGTGGGTAGPRTGSVWAWFGGIAAAETATASQSVTFPAGDSRFLNFYLWMGSVSGTAGATNMDVMIDSNIVASYPEPATADAAYSLRSIDVSAYSDGNAHTVKFNYVSPGTSSNYSVDDVTLDCAAGTPFQPRPATHLPRGPITHRISN